MKPSAWVLDLGSTRMKLAGFHPPNHLRMLADKAFPQVKAAELFCEADPQSFRDRVRAMLMKIPADETGIPLGISSQRSSFLLWERATGKPLTRIVCWQDRRAQNWCEAQAAWEPLIWARTGLPFSPHYAGPKLAYILAKDRWLAALARSGTACFGTLETYLAWCWSKGAVFQTDPGMAARTLLVDLDSGTWSPEILETFGIPRAVLPDIKPFEEANLKAPYGGSLVSVIPDQSAAALPVFASFPKAVVLNAGTGTFLLRQGQGRAPRGFLTARLTADQLGGTARFWEAPINAGASLWRECKSEREPGEKPEDTHFAAPETYGWAAPYWRGDLGQTCAGETLTPGLRAHLLMEGYAFRVREVIEGLFPEDPPEQVLIGGGLAHDEVWLLQLAKYLGLPLTKLTQAQLSLLGVGWQVSGRREALALQLETVDVMPHSSSERRYKAWRSWIKQLVGE